MRGIPNRLVKCPICEEQLKRIDARYDGKKKRYYHEDCFSGKNIVLSEREELEQYICKLYKIDRITGQMGQQINHYEKNLGYTIKGMELTLKYFHEILGRGVKEGSGLGIIPYVYEDATKQYQNRLEVEEALKILKKPKEITVYVKKDRNERKKKHIDLDSI